MSEKTRPFDFHGTFGHIGRHKTCGCVVYAAVGAASDYAHRDYDVVRVTIQEACEAMATGGHTCGKESQRCARCGNTGPWTTYTQQPQMPVIMCPLCVCMIVAEWSVKKQDVDDIKTS